MSASVAGGRCSASVSRQVMALSSKSPTIGAAGQSILGIASGIHSIRFTACQRPPVLPSEVKPKGNFQVEQYVSKIKASCSEVLTFVTWDIGDRCHKWQGGLVHLRPLRPISRCPAIRTSCALDAHFVRLEQPPARMTNRKRHR